MGKGGNIKKSLKGVDILKLPSIEFIKKKAHELELTPIEAIFMNKEGLSLQVDIIADQEDAVTKFMMLVKDLGKTTFFFNIVVLYDEVLDSWLINVDNITEDNYGDDFLEIASKAAQYNNDIRNKANKGPALIELFLCSEGTAYSLCFCSDWYESIKDPEEVLEQICLNYEEKINEIKKKKYEEKANYKEELAILLDGEKDFQHCTNKKARKEYAFHFIRKHEKDQGKHRFLIREIEDIAELAWVKIKAKNNR